ncbi:MAG: 2-iminoacetate synthase ThiH [Taibaiella sp.]|nr:2-iminoacetate synthase ThiH [Taibaiella sp.]
MFKEVFDRHSWDEVVDSIYAKTAADVERALGKTKRDLEDFKAMISPAAAPYLERMAQMSNRITQKRFGKTVQLYAPMYLSNECQNICTYCGFSLDNKLRRKTLTGIEMMQEVEFLKKEGFDHVLLVTGEANKTVGVDYLRNAVKLLRPHFANISIEVQPLEQDEYECLIDEGLYAVLVYQETYHKDNYKQYHPKGKKSNFDYRLATPDRLGNAGVHKIGLGVLIGLEDWRADNFFTALHVDYLERQYWQTKYSISFPRLRPAEGLIEPKVVISDKELVQLICAWRIYNEEIELSVSTRESALFRDNIIKLGATTISAGSRTNPGGYSVEPESLEQFEIDDSRTVAEVQEMIERTGYKPVWKDWFEQAVV